MKLKTRFLISVWCTIKRQIQFLRSFWISMASACSFRAISRSEARVHHDSQSFWISKFSACSTVHAKHRDRREQADASGWSIRNTESKFQILFGQELVRFLQLIRRCLAPQFSEDEASLRGSVTPSMCGSDVELERCATGCAFFLHLWQAECMTWRVTSWVTSWVHELTATWCTSSVGTAVLADGRNICGSVSSRA